MVLERAAGGLSCKAKSAVGADSRKRGERSFHVQARRVGGHSRSCLAGATPRVGRRAHEKGSLPGGRLPLVNVRKLCGLRLLRGFGLRFCNGLRWWLLGEPRFLLGGELLLYLEADGIHIHLVRGCRVAEDLRCVLPHGRVENGYLYQ